MSPFVFFQTVPTPQVPTVQISKTVVLPGLKLVVKGTMQHKFLCAVFFNSGRCLWDASILLYVLLVYSFSLHTVHDCKIDRNLCIPPTGDEQFYCFQFGIYNKQTPFFPCLLLNIWYILVEHMCCAYILYTCHTYEHMYICVEEGLLIVGMIIFSF